MGHSVNTDIHTPANIINSFILFTYLLYLYLLNVCVCVCVYMCILVVLKTIHVNA